MLALYRSGNQAKALHVFAESRQRLVDDLGIEPGPALQQLERQILNQDPALSPPPPAETVPTNLSLAGGAADRESSRTGRGAGAPPRR
jgi:DNA-binding SARP family transcriptional activator